MAACRLATNVQERTAYRQGRYPEIDGVRGVLSLIVVAGHVLEMVAWPNRLGERESPLFWYWGTMEIFFCISGFLITRGLVSSTVIRRRWISTYLLKRVLRIWPAYYVALVACLGVSIACADPVAPFAIRWNGDLLYLAKTILFLQYTEHYWTDNSAGAIPTFSHSWSVALEEQFYIGILLLIFMRHRFGIFEGRRLILPIVLLLPLAEVSRMAGFSQWTLLGRLDGFLVGIALAVLEPQIQSGRARLANLSAEAKQVLGVTVIFAGFAFVVPYLATYGSSWSTLSPALRHGLFNPNFGFAMAGAALLVSIMLIPASLISSVWRIPALRYLGLISYSTYLFHRPVLFVVHSLTIKAGLPSPFFVAIAPILVLAAAHTANTFVERPFLRIKARITQNNETATNR